MQTVCFSSIKGGAGKTTSLMVIASALVERGIRVGILETDDNQPLGTWREYALDFDTWDDTLCRIYLVSGPDDLEKAFEEAEEEEVQILLVDTRGGGSEFNDMIMLNSDMVVIPTGLSVMEMDEALQGLDFALETLRSSNRPIPASILANRVSSEKRMPATHKEALELLGQVPVFTSYIKNRQVFQDIKATGMLGLYLKKLEASKGRQMMVEPIRAYLDEGNAVANELLEELKRSQVT